jgi:hypothetical protein
MENIPSAIIKVEELENFPFKSFQELINSWRERKLVLNFDTRTAHNMAFAAGGLIMNVISLSEWSLILVPIGFVIYIILNQTWLLLLSLPLFIIAPFAFNQDSSKSIRRGLFLLTAAVFLWSIVTSVSNITILSISLLIIWLAQKIIHDFSLNVLTNSATKDQSLLCALWQNNDMSITFTNGNEFSVLYKTVNGNKVYYKIELAHIDKQLPERPKHHL